MSAYNAVAGNNQRYRITADSLSYCLRGTATDHPGYLAIRLGLTITDSQKRLPYFALEVGSLWIELRRIVWLSAVKIIIQPFPCFRYYGEFFAVCAGFNAFRLVREPQTRQHSPVAFNDDGS